MRGTSRSDRPRRERSRPTSSTGTAFRWVCDRSSASRGGGLHAVGYGDGVPNATSGTPSRRRRPGRWRVYACSSGVRSESVLPHANLCITSASSIPSRGRRTAQGVSDSTSAARPTGRTAGCCPVDRRADYGTGGRPRAEPTTTACASDAQPTGRPLGVLAAPGGGNLCLRNQLIPETHDGVARPPDLLGNRGESGSETAEDS
jgi:hypothetical protein